MPGILYDNFFICSSQGQRNRPQAAQHYKALPSPQTPDGLSSSMIRSCPIITPPPLPMLVCSTMTTNTAFPSFACSSTNGENVILRTSRFRFVATRLSLAQEFGTGMERSHGIVESQSSSASVSPPTMCRAPSIRTGRGKPALRRTLFYTRCLPSPLLSVHLEVCPYALHVPRTRSHSTKTPQKNDSKPNSQPVVRGVSTTKKLIKGADTKHSNIQEHSACCHCTQYNYRCDKSVRPAALARRAVLHAVAFQFSFPDRTLADLIMSPSLTSAKRSSLLTV